MKKTYMVYCYGPKGKKPKYHYNNIADAMAEAQRLVLKSPESTFFIVEVIGRVTLRDGKIKVVEAI